MGVGDRDGERTRDMVERVREGVGDREGERTRDMVERGSESVQYGCWR